MMRQVYSNASDPMQGRQLPVMYSSQEGRLLHDLRQSRHASAASGGLGDGVGLRGRRTHRVDVARRRLDCGRRFPRGDDVRRRLSSAPVIINVVNNQWAISSFQGIAGGENTTFAARGVGYGMPPLRVDGNDFLAVYAVTQWAAERARANLGPDADRTLHLSRRPALDVRRSRRAIARPTKSRAGRWAIRSSA